VGADRVEIVKNILRLGAFLQREGDRLIGRYGLTQQQFVVLKEIQERGPISQRDICSELLYEKSNVSKIVKKLAVEGLVRRTVSAEDGRLGLLKTTKKGVRLIGLCMSTLNIWNRYWLRPLSEAQVKEALDVLDALKVIQKPA
jgi:DNA-binding MarR family transcriptional regulator